MKQKNRKVKLRELSDLKSQKHQLLNEISF